MPSVISSEYYVVAGDTTMENEHLLEAVRESLLEIIHPRFYETERGFQGQLVSNLNARLEEIGLGNIIVEEEYPKVFKQHGLKIRPDVIIHVPFEGSGLENRREGNFVVFELKRDATQEDAFHDFDKLEQMGNKLNYPLGIFVNIASGETYLENYEKKANIELHSFAVNLIGDQVVIRECHL